MLIGKVGEVLTLQLHDIILNIVAVSKTAKTKVSATKEKGRLVPIFVGEVLTLQSYDVILNVEAISKTAKTKVSATKG